jgi:hypothetical protein
MTQETLLTEQSSCPKRNVHKYIAVIITNIFIMTDVRGRISIHPALYSWGPVFSTWSENPPSFETFHSLINCPVADTVSVSLSCY